MTVDGYPADVDSFGPGTVVERVMGSDDRPLALLAASAWYGSRTSGCDLRLSVPGWRFGRTWGSRFVIMCL
jgi:hypothetical protein